MTDSSLRPFSRALSAIGMAVVVGALVVSGCGQRAAPVAPAQSGTYVFHVKGMHCSGCERAIGDVVGKLDGITLQSLSHSNGFLRVESDGRTDPEAVIAAIEPLGYQASAATAALE